MVLFRAVDIGADLFAMTAACVRANMLASQGNRDALELADLFCREARIRINANFGKFFGANDAAMYRISQRVLDGAHAWLEEGIVGMLPHDSSAPPAKQAPVTKQEPAGV
jgi:hypothetical protein